MKLKKLCSLLLVLCMCASFIPGVAFATGDEVELLLQYGDYNTFEGAENVTSSAPAFIEVDGNTIHAAAVTETPVTVTVDGTDYAVTVEKANVYLVLLDGQSNAWGEYNANIISTDPVMPAKGDAFLWDAGSLVDMNTYLEQKIENEPKKTRGVYPAFAAEWIALYPGEKVVVIHKGHGGRPISSWALEDGTIQGFTTEATDAISNCISAMDASENFNIVRAGYYWFQGESNLGINGTGYNIDYTNANEYQNSYLAMHNALKTALQESGVTDVRGGIFTVRRELSGNTDPIAELKYGGARAAMQNLANQYSDIFIASSVVNQWKTGSTVPFSFTSDAGTTISAESTWSDLRTDTSPYGHYTQPAYNIMGLEAADSAYKAYFSAVPTNFDFRLMAADGWNSYSDNDVIDLADNMLTVGQNNPEEVTAAQLTVVPNYGFVDCSPVTYTLKNSNGDTLENVIGNNGYIPDVTALPSDMTLTVACGGISKEYFVNPSPSSRHVAHEFYWTGFKNSSVSTGTTLSSVTTEGWEENTLTANGNYFVMESPVTLGKNENWTVEFQNTPANSGDQTQKEGVIISGVNGNAGYYIYTANKQLWFIFNGSVSNKIAYLSADDAVLNNPNTVWYVTNDGDGNITIGYELNGVQGETIGIGSLGSSHPDTISFENILGYYMSSSPTLYYSNGRLEYLKIYRSTVLLGEQNVPLNAYAGYAQTTELETERYTGTAVWTPASEAFELGESYSAAVTLTAKSGFTFPSDAKIAVANGTVSNIVVSADGTTVSFAVELNAAEKPGYYWNGFTATNVSNGTVLHAQAGDGWADNDLTANGNYFVMDHVAGLEKEEHWTVEFKNKPISGKQGVIISDANGGGGYYIYASNNQVWFVYNDSVGSATATLVADSAVLNDPDTVWYVTDDGSGNITIGYTLNGVPGATIGTGTLGNGKPNNIDFSNILGYYAKPSSLLKYDKDNLDYVKIYYKTVILGEQEDAVTAPVLGAEPQTTIDATSYSGTVVWSPAVAGTFAEKTAYTATVTLTAKPGFLFESAATVAGASSVSVSADGSTLTYSKTFEETEEISYVAQIGEVKYESLNEAIDAATKAQYPAAAAQTTIELLCDAEGGFDVGVEAYPVDTSYRTQNIVLNLNDHTLKLGHPLVGSSSTKDNGIRVLAHSTLTINDGALVCDNTSMDNMMKVYGECTLNNVTVGTGTNIVETIHARGTLTLSGTTSVANGQAEGGVAIKVEPYDYSDPTDVDVDAVLNIASADVTVGKIDVSLAHVEAHGCVNNGVPAINISAGSIESIYTTGDEKTPDGNITGGTFGAVVPENLCGEGYIPVTTPDAQGKYTVEAGFYVTFDTNGGTPETIDAQTIPAGGKANKPTDPTREGFVFAGWFAESAETVFDFNTAINANTTLTAHWANATEIVSVSRVDGNCVATIYSAEADETITVWAARYKDDGQFLSVEKMETTLTAGETTFSVEIGDAATVRFFVVDKNFAPVCLVKELSASSNTP